MKKRVFLFLIIAALTIAVCACGGSSVDTGKQYEYNYNPIFRDECDEDMKIDGVLDEERWQGKNVFSHVTRGIEIRTTATLTGKGAYIAAVAYDPSITWYGRLDMRNNSCFQIYVALDDAEKAKPFDALRFDVDSKNIRSYNQARFSGASTVVGEVNSGDTFCLTAEIFVSWKALGYEGDGRPTRVKIDPVYNAVKKSGGGKTERTRIYPFLTVETYMYSYLEFDENGYVSEGEDDTLGNAANGMSRSDGWDLSESADGKVTSVKRGQQALFFKGVNADNFYAKATVRPIDAINDSNPQIGLVTVGDFISYRALFVNVNSYFSGSAVARLMTPYPTEYGWNESGVITSRKLSADEKSDGLQVEVVKAGNHLLYFIESRLVYDEFLGYIEGKACPALYALGCRAEFTDYEARALSDEETSAYLNGQKRVYLISVAETGGGSFTPDEYAIEAGKDLTVTMEPDLGYYLTDFKLNGASAYDYVKSGTDGKFTVPASEITGDVVLDASFKYVAPRGNDRKTVNVTVRSDVPQAGYNVPGAKIEIRDEENPLLRYTLASTGDVLSVRTLPVAGTTLTDGVTASGKYSFTVTAQGYHVASKKITLTADSGPIATDFDLVPYAVGGIAKAGESVYVSEYDVAKGDWEIDDLNADGTVKPLDKVKVTAYKGSSNDAMYFAGESGTKAIIEFTIENLCDGTTYDEKAPGAGVIISNRSTEIEAILFNDYVRVMPDRMWLIDGNQEHRNGAGYNFSRYGAKIRVRVVHDGARLTMYADTAPDDGIENFVEIYSGIHEDLNLPSAYAITVTQTANAKVEFTDFKFIGSSDPAISDKIKEISYGKITIAPYSAATVTVNGTDEDGYALKGSKVTLSVEGNDGIVTLALGGKKYVVRGNGSFDYTVTGSETVVVSALENAFAVTGTITVGDNARGLNVNLADTFVTASDGTTTYAFVGVSDGAGNYSAFLPAGSYSLVFDNPNLLPVTKTVGVTADKPGEDVTFVYARPVSETNIGDVVVKGSAKTWAETTNGYVSAVGDREVKYFDGAGSKYSIEVTIDAPDTAKSPMAGIEITDGTTSYLYMILATPTVREVYFIRKSDWKATRIGTFEYSSGKVTLKAVSDGESISLYVGSSLRAVVTSGSAAMKGSENFIGSDCALGLISNSHATSFGDVKISIGG